MILADNWKDYKVLDSSDGEKLEKWGPYVLLRPDPQVLWHTPKKHPAWVRLNAHYHRSSKGGGEWEFFDLPKQWQISYDLPIGRTLTFNLQPFSFKHTGLFPEQAANWDWFSQLIAKRVKTNQSAQLPREAQTNQSAQQPREAQTNQSAQPSHEAQTNQSAQQPREAQPPHETQPSREAQPPREVRILNLFAYTGGATLAAAAAGAKVTHVDASKGMVNWAKENAESSGLSDAPIRWLVDDCVKFVEREIRRGNTYDGIIMDPPSYGRGPKGEIWKIEDSIYELVSLCAKLLSDDPLFFLINSYTTGLQPGVLSYMLESIVRSQHGGTVHSDEIGLPVHDTPLVLPCGAAGRWQSDHI